jgi:hypothetical protein
VKEQWKSNSFTAWWADSNAGSEKETPNDLGRKTAHRKSKNNALPSEADGCLRDRRPYLILEKIFRDWKNVIIIVNRETTLPFRLLLLHTLPVQFKELGRRRSHQHIAVIRRRQKSCLACVMRSCILNLRRIFNLTSFEIKDRNCQHILLIFFTIFIFTPNYTIFFVRCSATDRAITIVNNYHFIFL